MSGDERRKKIVNVLSLAKKPVSGEKLAGELKVSRQVIVQDIALLRAGGFSVLSTNRGYLLQPGEDEFTRVLKVVHTEEQVEDELETVVDAGGSVRDVFVYHKVYGVIRADLNIRSRRDIRNFLDQLSNGKSTLLMNVTAGYHYHTVCADSEETLDEIQAELQQKGYLAGLMDYEPVDFWKKD